jgi:UDP-glucuronate decarboxylase
MRILVTGGAGFVGSHLCDRLIDAGHSVICLDNLLTGSESNIQHLKTNPRFEFVNHDVVVPFHFEVDQIYNLACPASPVHYQADPIRTIQTSFMGALNCLEMARNLKIKVLQASTSEVYGDPAVHPQSESYWGNVHITGPRACYDEGKRAAETLFADYHRCHNVPIRIVRIFNTYGPRMHKEDGRVVSNFIVEALKGEPISIYGQGEQTRSFCYVDDLVEGIIRLMNHPDYTSPVNLGNSGEFTIKALAEIILRLTGSRSKLAYHPLPEDDPQRRKPDIQIAKTYLDWQPTVSLEEGLIKTIAYFKRVL